MKKVSVIMPVYNGEKYLKESIDSIICQTYSNWELIIVLEFNSNEESKNIIKYFQNKDSRIKVIENETKKGISESLNIGIKNATGDYIARMDGDDISGINRLEEQVYYLDTHKNIGVCGIIPEFFGDSNIGWKIETNSQVLKHDLFFYLPCLHPTIMIRKNILLENNIFYNKEYTATEDYDFLSKLGVVTEIANIDNKNLFKYRLHSSNATSVNNLVGIKNYNTIMKKNFKDLLDLDFSDEEISLLNPHISIKETEKTKIYNALIQLDLLLKKILLASSNNENFDKDLMYFTLKKRWTELFWTISEDIQYCNNGVVRFLLEKSIFNYDCFEKDPILKKVNPDITVLLPIYNGEKYILDSIKSLLEQTYTNFVIMVIVEKGTEDDTLKYLSLFKDKRIKIIKNKEKLGLADSLNYGIKIAKSKYIARMDADDLSDKERFAKQIDYLENNPDISLVCTWQRHFGNFGMYNHETEANYEDLKASLLFRCDVCHSTVMLRRDVLIKNNYYYDNSIAMEDFDLWNRMLSTEKLACIPEILGYYRIHNENITQSKFNKVIDCEKNIIGRSLKKLNIPSDSYDSDLLIGWKNIYLENPALIEKAESLFNLILKQNKKIKVYNQDSLKKAIYKRRDWMYNYTLNVQKTKESINFKQILKKCTKPLLRPLYNKVMYRIDLKLKDYSENNINHSNYRFDRLEQQVSINNLILNQEFNKKLSEINTLSIRQNRQSEQLLEKNSLIEKDLKKINNLFTNKFNDLEYKLNDNLKTINSLKGEIDFYKDIFLNNSHKIKKIFFVCTSEHNNIGDAGIVVGGYEFIYRYFKNYPIIELSTYEYDKKIHYIEKMINNDDIILINGGGNLGNKYKYEEKVKRNFVEKFPNNKIVIMPQTIYYDDTEDGARELEITKEIFNKHKNLTIFTRGNISYEFACKHFYNSKCYLALDTALIIEKDYNFERNGILCCIRDLDDESGLTRDEYNKIFEIVKSFDVNYESTNNLYFKDIIKEHRNSILNEQLEKFAKHRLIVTDRLHGIIFSLISKTPCIVISSYNYKLNEFIENISDCDNILFVDKNVEELANAIPKFLNKDFSNKNYEKSFEEIYKRIKED